MAATPSTTTPLLRPGERLTQPEFHRRYAASPRDVNAELIRGIVYFTPPANRTHATTLPQINLVVGIYKSATPGVEVGIRLSTILGEHSEVQPDLMLRLQTEYGGRSHYNHDDYLIGAPELVVEIADSDESIVLGDKRHDYQRAGGLEYLVVCLRERAIHWFHFPSRRKLRPDRHGIWRSKVFPGLWLDGPALLARDSQRLMAAVQQGVATPEHAAFVAQLEAARGRR